MSADRVDELTVVRVVDAPIEAVWDAFTTRAGLATWWWAGWDDATHEIDASVGGRYRFAVPSIGIAVSGEFVEVSPPHRLVMTWVWEDDGEPGPNERVCIELSGDDVSTTVTVVHSGPWTTAQAATDYEQGWNDVLRALAGATVTTTASRPPSAARVTGIGGVFFRSADPAATVAWYEQHLGITPEVEFPCATFDDVGGQTVWAPFVETTDYFGDGGQEFMVNYRVDDLDAMIARLRGAGVEVSDPSYQEQGAFAWAVDGDGRRFELWQPPADQ